VAIFAAAFRCPAFSWTLQKWSRCRACRQEHCQKVISTRGATPHASETPSTSISETHGHTSRVHSMPFVHRGVFNTSCLQKQRHAPVPCRCTTQQQNYPWTHCLRPSRVPIAIAALPMPQACLREQGSPALHHGPDGWVRPSCQHCYNRRSLEQQCHLTCRHGTVHVLETLTFFMVLMHSYTTDCR
jgi:hypothetical protein